LLDDRPILAEVQPPGRCLEHRVAGSSLSNRYMPNTKEQGS
jgi:hypothetical protein